MVIDIIRAVTTGYAKVRGALGPTPCFDVTEGPPTSHICLLENGVL